MSQSCYKAGYNNSKTNLDFVWLSVLSLASLLCYVVIGWLSRSFGQDRLAQERPTWIVLGVLALAFVFGWLAQRLVLRRTASRWIVIGIIATSCSFRLVLLPTTPIHEIDIYRYIWDGAVTAEGLDPYRYSPQQVLDASIGNSPLESDLSRLVELRNRSESLADSLSRVHYGEYPSPYPMVSQWVFALAAKLTPDTASPQTRLVIMKGMLVAFDVATLLLLVLLLRETGRHLGWCLAYGWCPLVLKEIANSGHLDSIAVFFTTLALGLLVRTCRKLANSSRAAQYSAAAGVGAVVSLAIGAKLYPVVLLPLFVVLWWRRLGVTATASGLLIVVALSFFMLKPMLLESGPREGIGVFLKHWEMNDLLFMVVLENLRPQSEVEAKSKPWFAVIPDETSRSLIIGWEKLVRWTKHDLLGLLPENDKFSSEESIYSNQAIRSASFQLTRALTGTITAAIAIWLAIRMATPEQGPADWCRAAMLTLAWFWLLCPTQNPWYWCWVVPLLPFAKYRAWHAVGAFSLLYYLRFWFQAHFPEPPVAGTPYDGESFYYFVIVWLEYVPCLAWLCMEWFWNYRIGQSAHGRPLPIK